MKLILLLGLGCLSLISSYAGEAEGKLAVEEVVSRALAANPMLKASAAKWASMKERVPQAKAWEDPMVGVDFERMGTTRFSTYSDAEWMASQSLPISGKNLSRGRAAEAEARAAYEDVRRLRLEVTAKAKVAYHRLANAHAQLAINRQNRGLFESVLAIGNAKLSVGKSAQGDVLATETDIQRLDIERESLAQALSDQQTALNVLMNRPAGSPLGQPAALAFRPMRADPGQLEARLLAQRPEIAAAEQRLKAEEARLQLAHREWIPDPQVRVEARQFRGSGDTFTEYDTGIFFSVPWVNPRKYSAGVREAQQMVEAMRREIEGERATALGMLRDQLRKITAFRRQYELSRDKLLPLARKTTETLRINYQTDTATFIEMLTVQRMLRDAEATTSTQLTDYLAALAELEAIVGSDPTETASAKTITTPSKRRKP
ncbi:MAG: TolC family protein [Chthoniobacteraceae bacterium]